MHSFLNFQFWNTIMILLAVYNAQQAAWEDGSGEGKRGEGGRGGSDSGDISGDLEHTWDVSFLLHTQDFRVNFAQNKSVQIKTKSALCQNIVNFSYGANFVMWSNDKLLQITDVKQFVVAPHDKIAPHDKQVGVVVQNCLSYGAFVIHMRSKICLVEQNYFTWAFLPSAAPATNITYDRDPQNQWIHTKRVLWKRN